MVKQEKKIKEGEHQIKRRRLVQGPNLFLCSFLLSTYPLRWRHFSAPLPCVVASSRRRRVVLTRFTRGGSTCSPIADALCWRLFWIADALFWRIFPYSRPHLLTAYFHSRCFILTSFLVVAEERIEVEVHNIRMVPQRPEKYENFRWKAASIVIAGMRNEWLIVTASCVWKGCQ